MQGRKFLGTNYIYEILFLTKNWLCQNRFLVLIDHIISFMQIQNMQHIIYHFVKSKRFFNDLNVALKNTS